MVTYSIYLSLNYRTKPNALQVHSCCYKWLIFILFYCWVIFSYCMYVCVCIHHIIFMYSSVNEYLGCFQILAIVNNVVRNIGVHVCFRFNVFIFFEYISRSGISGLYDSSIFSFLRNIPTVFHDDCPNLHFCQQCPLSQHTRQHLLSMVFLMIAIPTSIT